MDKIKSPFIKMFDSFEEYKKYGEELTDVDIISNVKLISNYGRRLPGLLFDIKNRTVESEINANLILSTAHKSKGCEWDYVDIAEDYHPIFNEENPLELLKIPEEEINLFYVTITRAKRGVSLNKELIKFTELFSK